MIDNELLVQLQQLQNNLLEIVKNIPASDHTRQFHPELSPPGWHLGHCVFTENYWLRDVVMGMEKTDDELKQLYIPELSVKTTRSAALPKHNELCNWAENIQNENIEYLSELIESESDVELMQDDYLIFFLCQHYAQHIETISYVLAQRNLQIDSDFKVNAPLTAKSLRFDYHQLDKGEYLIGADDPLRHYDNECPGFSIPLDTFQIANTAVSNAEFLGFIEAEAYQNKEYWDANAWQWCEQNNISCPQHWRLDEAGDYYGTDASGPFELKADKAVTGLSLYEAKAVANWARARLPHEYEWEVAKKADLLAETGYAWEWCHNDFHPYSDFKAFPYEGYSLPWFDQQHFTLRGGSEYTQPVIVRDTFRNFYQADKRHFPAGLRLATA
jgi:ergothioneine biosynthesis protein EgtB